ncbi:hypothetical protein HDU97_009484 [Phlyctochytrium planicorne]|nr:hypothetical protein HDU97_009484 [Phlyctochytrium planicorne]
MDGFDGVHASLLASILAAKEVARAGDVPFDDPLLGRRINNPYLFFLIPVTSPEFIECRDRFYDTTKTLRERLTRERELLIQDERVALEEKWLAIRKDIDAKDRLIQKFLERSQGWYAILNHQRKSNNDVLDRTYRNPDLIPKSMEEAIRAGDLPIPTQEEDDIVPPKSRNGILAVVDEEEKGVEDVMEMKPETEQVQRGFDDDDDDLDDDDGDDDVVMMDVTSSNIALGLLGTFGASSSSESSSTALLDNEDNKALSHLVNASGSVTNPAQLLGTTFLDSLTNLSLPTTSTINKVDSDADKTNGASNATKDPPKEPEPEPEPDESKGIGFDFVF